MQAQNTSVYFVLMTDNLLTFVMHPGPMPSREGVITTAYLLTYFSAFTEPVKSDSVILGSVITDHRQAISDTL